MAIVQKRAQTCVAISHTGGSTLYIESILKRALETSGGGAESKEPPASMELTGHLGDVMKESAAIAYTFAKSFLAQKFPDNNFLQKAQIHVHVPEVCAAHE